jgi:methylenetetrahydrofolate dehydrogenase (NADP+)/methenyltetrahydrofolate cyclohydrolase
MTATLINGKAIAQEIRSTIRKQIEHLRTTYHFTPRISTVMVGENPSSALYLKLRDAACREVGITSHHINIEADASEDTVLQTIETLNSDPTTHGILVQYPLPSHLSQERLMRTVTPQKDIEGFNPINLGRTFIGDEFLVPCTPLAVLTILEHEHVSLKGQDVVVINHSNVVGKPLAALLLNRNATVSICHVFTKKLQQYTTNADILITGTGVPNLITKDHIKEAAVVIDIGIATTNEGVRGDVDSDSVSKKAALLTPVPGGVGPVTIACSLINMVKIFSQSCTNIKEK